MDNHYQDTSAAAEECSEVALAGLDDDDEEDEPDLKDAEDDEEVGDTETLISFAEFDQAVAQLREAGVQVSSKQSGGLKKQIQFDKITTTRDNSDIFFQVKVFQDTKDPLKPGVNANFNSDKCQDWELFQFFHARILGVHGFLFISPPSLVCRFNFPQQLDLMPRDRGGTHSSN